MIHSAKRTGFLARSTAALGALAVLAACSSTSNTPADPRETASTADANTATDSDTTARPGRTFTEYVALGDSYAALGSTNLGYPPPTFCQRSPDNYPNLVASATGVATFTDATCQGGQTPDMFAPRHQNRRDPTSAAVPPQLDSLTATTDLVTVSIGGNDIGFGPLAECFGRAMLAGQPSDCESQHSASVTAALAELPAQLEDVYSAIRDRAPQATIIATQYMPLIAIDDTCTQISALTDSDRSWATGLTAELNAIVAAAAERHDATAVLPDDVNKHTGCATRNERWVDFLGLDTNAAPMHPTAAGQRAMADAIVQHL